MSWKRVKLGDILTESKIVSEYPNPDRRITVRLKVLGVEKRGLENEVEGATKQYVRKTGQFIYGKQNFHKGAFGIVPPELDGFESSSDLPAFDVDKSCLPEFIFYFFKQGNFYLELSKIASGVATQRINTTQLFELELLLPDIKTQRQLILNIQLLEKNGSQISTELTHQLSLVKKLRQQLLQDAVQGKLVEQNKKDEPASELLKKIKAEKEKLIAEKKLKKEKELAPIKPEEIPFDIPESWVWCRLGEMFEIVRGSSPRPKGDPKYWSKESTPFHWITIADFTPYGINGNLCDTKGFLTEEGSKKSRIVKIGDLLVACSGVGSVGRSIHTSIDGFIYDGILAIRSIPNESLKELVKHFLKYKEEQIYSVASGANWLNINIEILSNYIFPLPPLSEQKRILEKLDELMQYCNELEASIKESETQNEKLLQQVLREALRKELKSV
ncbi:MAG: restriction endonuclease subunit S [bacterium]|nr:restriction endonuclease subunit S [bacterium]